MQCYKSRISFCSQTILFFKPMKSENFVLFPLATIREGNFSGVVFVSRDWSLSRQLFFFFVSSSPLLPCDALEQFDEVLVEYEMKALEKSFKYVSSQKRFPWRGRRSSTSITSSRVFTYTLCGWYPSIEKSCQFIHLCQPNWKLVENKCSWIKNDSFINK